MRHLAAPLLFAAEKYMSPANQQHKPMRLLLHIAVRLVRLLGENKNVIRFSPQTQASGPRVALSPRSVQPLRIDSMSRASFCSITRMLHLGFLGADINPRAAWRYASEDLLHRTKLLVQKCARGTSAHLVAAKAMANYAVGRGINMEQDI